MALNQTFNQDSVGDIGTAAAVSTSAPTYTSGTTSPLSLTTVGNLRVDGSSVTQPVSASSLPLPTGASTSALQTTTNTTLTAISGQLPTTLGAHLTAASLAVSIASDQVVPISATALPLPTGAATSALQTQLSGQIPTTLGQKTSSASLAVVIASDQSAVSVSTVAATTPALTSVSGSVASVSILASNTSRKSFIVTNDSTAILYLAYGATASTTAYSVKMYPNACYISDFVYTGALSAIWSAAAGSARITELT